MNGLRDGITREQYPQVAFCLHYLIALRPNDLNKVHARINSPREDVLPVDDVVACGKFDDFDVCGR